MLACPAAARAVPAQAPPAPADVDPVLWNRLQDIGRVASKIETLTADFTQRRHTSLLKEPLESSGQVLVKGGRTIWHTVKPRKNDMLITDDELRLYYPEEKLLEIYPIGRRGGELAASPVPRLETLVEYFTIRSVATTMIEDEQIADAVTRGDLLAVRLVPHDPELARHLSQIDVFIRTETAYARRVEMTDTEGERTVLVFENVKTNEPLDDARLRLDVADDVRISRPLQNAGGEGDEGDDT